MMKQQFWLDTLENDEVVSTCKLGKFAFEKYWLEFFSNECKPFVLNRCLGYSLYLYYKVSIKIGRRLYSVLIKIFISGFTRQS